MLVGLKRTENQGCVERTDTNGDIGWLSVLRSVPHLLECQSCQHECGWDKRVNLGGT
jgi:hypothetical protein